ncbi:hypothetical protein MELA_02106 [Candidatus Methylomirabilis lanthanidiphila]|uniref:3-keto-alpha-glucoside-1,2-lyase/3-keto-2-hydroxy-glucal hydratase domain-containing protein n=1 Tax=Candidatus Methylomirabilis lanthanidiphila TaxID=2211376 RepID=A0A564ZK62_9BACT|nr:DUF1080 domain-containing protein [Candidatus Methylomirabilis lanthanidiphila]VUZ85721.1 hypothetical protein MELA_02106 [Candidatus Methylomirabilis lanthanidiphila]
MKRITPLRRQVCGLILSGLGWFGLLLLTDLIQVRQSGGLMAEAAELTVPEGAPVTSFDFEKEDLGGWKVLGGQWTVEEMPDAPSGKRALIQRADEHVFNVIVTPAGAFHRVAIDISVKFKPLSGREDASGGIVFRLTAGEYYVIRANALENNFRLYYYNGELHMRATANVQPLALRTWHTIRVVAVGDQIQGWLDDQLLIDYEDMRSLVRTDPRLELGEVGLWTKADSVTAFDNFMIRGFALSK